MLAMDSTSDLLLPWMLHEQKGGVLMAGTDGTVKTSTAFLFFTELGPVNTASTRCAGNYRTML